MSKSENKEKPVEQQRDAGITRMLNTPPKPHKEMKKGKGQRKEVRREGKPSD